MLSKSYCIEIEHYFNETKLEESNSTLNNEILKYNEIKMTVLDFLKLNSETKLAISLKSVEFFHLLLTNSEKNWDNQTDEPENNTLLMDFKVN